MEEEKQTEQTDMVKEDMVDEGQLDVKESLSEVIEPADFDPEQRVKDFTDAELIF